MKIFHFFLLILVYSGTCAVSANFLTKSIDLISLFSVPSRPQYPSTIDLDPSRDLVIVLSSTSNRQLLVEGTRPSRRNVRTFIVTDSSAKAIQLTQLNKKHLETYCFVADEVKESDVKPYSKRPGDLRAAIAPWLAHEHYGESYKWMLYGDDDTLFYIGGVSLLLRHLSHMQPLAITDNIWLETKHPNPDAPRCLPCSDTWGKVVSNMTASVMIRGFSHRKLETRVLSPGHSEEPNLKMLWTHSDTYEVRDGNGADYTEAAIHGLHHGKGRDSKQLNALTVGGYLPPTGCPICTPSVACSPFKAAGKRCLARKAGAHGGAGILLSQGLMQAFPKGKIMHCFNRSRGASGGDRLLSNCFFKNKISYTDPGYWLARQLGSLGWALFSTSSNVDPTLHQTYEVNTSEYSGYTVFDNKQFKNILLDPADFLMRGQCDDHCKWIIRHSVSMHIAARFFPSLHQARKALVIAATSHAHALRILTKTIS